jgi:protein-disulfide isomerase
MNRTLVVAALLALGMFPSAMAFSQTTKDLSDLRREIDALKAGQTAIQKDILEIKNLLLQKELQAAREALQGRPAAAPAQAQAPAPAPETQLVLSIDGAPIKGEKNAKVTLIEFTDYQCPFCSRHFRETLPQIVNDYVNTGKVRYVLKEFPLESIHPLAFKAAEAASCAGEQGKYWEMHERLFTNQNALAAQQLPSHAEAVGLDAPKFKSCLEGGTYAAKVRKDLADAQKVGATGTPTFLLGITDPKATEVKTVRKLVGAQPYAAFKDAIESLLSAKN